MAFIWNPLLLTNELFCGVCQLLTKLDFAASVSCASQTLFPFCEQWQGAGSTAPWVGQMGNDTRPAGPPHPPKRPVKEWMKLACNGRVSAAWLGERPGELCTAPVLRLVPHFQHEMLLNGKS